MKVIFYSIKQTTLLFLIQNNPKLCILKFFYYRIDEKEKVADIFYDIREGIKMFNLLSWYFPENTCTLCLSRFQANSSEKKYSLRSRPFYIV